MMTDAMHKQLKNLALMSAATVVTTLITAGSALAQSSAGPAPKTKDQVWAIVVSIIFILAVAAVSMKKSKRTHQD